MAIYRVVYNGFDIWTPGVSDLISPKVEIELNTAGRLTFTFPPGHPDYYTIQPLKGTVVVWENNDPIWFGRPMSLERATNNEKSVYCEGALSYFNDSAQRPREKGNVSPSALFSSILETHNSQVPADRQFTAGTVSLPGGAIGWYNDYTDSMSALQSLLQKAGGYLIPRRDGSTNYIDYLYTLPNNTGQPVEFGLNMINFSREYAFYDKITSVMPIGGVAEGAEEATTIKDVNSGNDILDGAGVSEFGRIVKIVKYPDITEPGELLAAAQEYLGSLNFDPITITASAAELSFIDSSYQPFRVGRKYHIVSAPHDVDEWLPLVRMSIPMDRAAREITLGTNSNPGITELYKDLEKQVNIVKETIAPSVGGGEWDSPGSTGGGSGWGHWAGTETAYDAMESHDSKTIYMTYLEE